jgi:predicted nucleotidyltransferase
MPANILKILKEFKHGLTRIYGARFRRMYLFGSYARGDYEDGSDLDVLIILDSFRYHSTEIDRTSNLVSDLSLKYYITISPMFIRERDWLKGKKPLLRNVKSEGIKLYERRNRSIVA